jgi:hypothetical protein
MNVQSTRHGGRGQSPSNVKSVHRYEDNEFLECHLWFVSFFYMKVQGLYPEAPRPPPGNDRLHCALIDNYQKMCQMSSSASDRSQALYSVAFERRQEKWKRTRGQSN